MRARHGVPTWRHLGIGLLLSLTILLMGAYSFRPTVRVDVGDYYDRAFLQQFHEREVDAAGPGTTWEWPADQQVLELPGKAHGDLLVTVFAAEGQPDGILRGLGLSINGERIWLPRQGTRFLVGMIPADRAIQPRLFLRLEPGLREGPIPPPGLSGRVTLEPARTYRWSQARSTFTLPGIGRGAWIISLEGIVAHPDHHPVQAQVSINEQMAVSLPDDRAARWYHLLIPPGVTGSGDLHLTITANPYHDPRPLGMLVSEVRIAPVRPGAILAMLSWTFPPWTILLASATTTIALVICLARLGIPMWGVGGSGFAAVGGIAWGLAMHRFPVAFMLPSIAFVALWSLLVLIVLHPLAQRIADLGATDTTTDRMVFANSLLLIFFVGYWVKAVGMCYPYFVAIDVRWHMDKVRHLLNGALHLYYGTHSPLNESTMPLAEWGTEKPVIPYSPYYHMVATSFALLPWSLEFSANMVSLLLDCLRVLLIALLAIGGGLSKRAAILAALLYAVLPVNFLLHSWGNVPTTFGLFWTLAATTFIVVGWHRLHHRGPFVILTLLFLATLLFYTVAGVFMVTFLVLFTLLLSPWFVVRRPGGKASPRGPTCCEPTPHEHNQEAHTVSHVGVGAMWGAAVVAFLIALLAYYGQYIGPIIERTIPYFARALTRSSEELGKAQDIGWGVYLTRHRRLWDYGLLIPLIVATGWVGTTGITCWRQRKGFGDGSPPPERIVLWAAVASWIMVTWLFVPLAYKVSMVDKHFFVSIPFMVIATAATLDQCWRWRSVRVAMFLFFSYLALDALALWVVRVGTVRQ